jgi:hypothetical protein
MAHFISQFLPDFMAGASLCFKLIVHFIAQFLPDFIATLAGTGLSVWAAYRIYRHTVKNHEDEKKRFEKNRWEYFQYLLKNAKKSISSNLEFLESTMKTLADNIFIIPPIEQKPNEDLRRLLHNIDLEGIFQLYKRLFREDHQKENFYKVISKLDYFELKLDLLKVVFENAMRNDFGRRVDFNNSFIKAANQVDDIKSILFQEGRRVESLQVDEIAKEYKSKEGDNLMNYEYHYTNLLSPIHIILQKFASTINSPPGEIISDFESAIFKYNLIIKGNRSFQSELEEDKKQLESELGHLDKLIRPLLIPDIENNL